MKELGVVVVTHDSEALLPRCLGALSDDPQVEVLVIDNHSRDGSARVAAALGVSTIPLPENTGFSVACNVGARAIAARCQWVAFVNPDVVVPGAELVRAVREAPADVVALSPMVLDPGGRPQADIARPHPSAWGTAARYLLSARADLPSRTAIRSLHPPPPGIRYIDVAVTSGGCLLVRGDVFAALGGFDEAYFLNMEDVDLCCRLRDHGRRIVIDTEVSAVHAKGTSSSTVSRDQRMFECGRAEMVFFERNRPVWETVLVSASVTAGCIVRSAVRQGLAPQPAGWSSIVPMYRMIVREAAGSVARAVTHVRPAVPGQPVFVSR